MLEKGLIILKIAFFRNLDSIIKKKKPIYLPSYLICECEKHMVEKIQKQMPEHIAGSVLGSGIQQGKG